VTFDFSMVISTSIGGGAIYLMQRIASKIEHRLDQVEEHEKRLTVVEERCAIFHNLKDKEDC
jgi:hypothetical protein